MEQRTLGRPVAYKGMGLHTGKPVTLTLEPMTAGSGIQIMRTPGYAPFALTPYRVNETVRCTSVMGDEGETIRTVEHLMAALSICGIDNVLVGVEGEEVPLADGSSAVFMDLIDEAGIVGQGVQAVTGSLTGTFTVSDGDRLVMALPHHCLRVTCLFRDEHGSLGTQAYDGEIDSGAFGSEIGRARTIGFLREVERLREQGLALGGVLDSAVIIGGDGYHNSPRYPDEPVRHKALDLVGDMACLGRLNAHFVSIKGGHALNNKLARMLYDSLRL